MKKLLIYCLLLSLPLLAYSQKFTLKIETTLSFDTLYLRTFDGEKRYVNIIAAPHTAPLTTLSQKKALPAGCYELFGDSLHLFKLLVSEEGKTTFIVSVDENFNVEFKNSIENQHFVEFQEQIKRFKQQTDSIRRVYETARKTIPDYMLERMTDSLIAQERRVLEAIDAYKLRVISENEGTLLAAIASFARDIPTPPTEYFQDRTRLYSYFLEHLFDYYPFADERLSKSDMLSMKMIEWNKILAVVPSPVGAEAVTSLLNKAQANPNNYQAIFNKIEKVFGTLYSPHWDETIYLAMLHNALNYNQLSKEKHSSYQIIYNLHNKNLAGEQVPNFPILWADSSVSTLYDVKSPYTLLYFQNPDCPSCSEMRERMAGNSLLNQAIDEGKITVVTLYFEGDEALWRRYLTEKANPKYRHGWDYTQKIEQEQLFDLRIIPFLFLLDQDKKVIKKDLLIDEITDYLKRLN